LALGAACAVVDHVTQEHKPAGAAPAHGVVVHDGKNGNAVLKHRAK
jgi:hypothetical protein